MKLCNGCYNSFSGWWCDNCDTWPCTCVLEGEVAPVVKPLLLLDVDGPLNAYDGRRGLDHTWRRYKLNGYEVYLNRKHGPMLLAACETAGLELVWATTWEHDANDMIGPRIGLPKLPVVEWGFNAIEWKFNGVLDYAAGRPLAWLDDDFGHHVRERAWFEGERGDAPTLLHHVDPTVGIVQADLDAVIEWAAGL